MWRRDENDPDGPVELKVVEELFVRFGPVLELRLGGRVIETTGEHPFFRDGAWVAANELQVGDRLLCEDGTTIAVEGVRDTGAWVRIYNLRIADWHTYFVGCDEWGWAVWAHNLGCGEKTQIAENLFKQQKLTKQQAETAMAGMNLSEGQIRSVKDIARQQGWLSASNREGRRSTLTTREQVERVAAGFEAEGMQVVNVSKSVRLA